MHTLSTENILCCYYWSLPSKGVCLCGFRFSADDEHYHHLKGLTIDEQKEHVLLIFLSPIVMRDEEDTLVERTWEEIERWVGESEKR